MRSKYSREMLAPIVASCNSVAEVLKKLGLDHKAGGNYRFIQGKIRAHGLSMEHFKGAGWAKGLRLSGKIRVPNEALFVENCAHFLNGARMKERLVRLGWAYQCQACGLSEWLGRPLTLHLDHINGINNDNRFENLRFLCPNCHQQTETWGNRQPSARNKRPSRSRPERSLSMTQSR